MNKITNRKLILSSLAAWALAAAIVTGCQSSRGTATAPAEGAQASASSAGFEANKGAAELWAENCNRCHNARSPSSYSAAEWDVALLHMRMRVPLTAEEQRKILSLMKASQ